MNRIIDGLRRHRRQSFGASILSMLLVIVSFVLSAAPVHAAAQAAAAEPGLASQIAAFLTNPIVSTILLFIGIAGIAIEILIPGVIAPGAIGIIAFGLFFFGSYIAGYSGSETWILFAVGLLLLVLEVFIPSFGILGVLGAASLIAAVIRAAYDTSDAILSLGIAFVTAAIFVGFVAYALRKRGVWNRFILNDQLTSDESYMENLQREQLLGLEGKSLTPLRPSGTVIIEGRHIDVVTQGGYIERDRPIRIIRIDGSRIIVDELPEQLENVHTGTTKPVS
ncbi:NfeD family protein [Paenibacillus hunanensis]|uniref:NfeD family protein n=1 Tax=Paenibacillus hunanensis TaxID=539262 RepID=UPI002A69DA0A|nr:NfeD family protein [Paenibacillus hunanensis]WPP42798.1 NfeD family protein [Paenibacillus hunanensis]